MMAIELGMLFDSLVCRSTEHPSAPECTGSTEDPSAPEWTGTLEVFEATLGTGAEVPGHEKHDPKSRRARWDPDAPPKYDLEPDLCDLVLE